MSDPVETEPAKLPTRHMNVFLAFLTGVLVCGFMSMIAALFFLAIPDNNRETLVYMAGQLSGFTGASVAFWYSTTFQSGEKTNIIANSPPVQR
jgi:hypothetical protein